MLSRLSHRPRLSTYRWKANAEMTQVFFENWTDSQGNAAGGVASGRGFAISWQNGPLGRGGQRREQNGAFVEDVIKAAVNRLAFHQGGKFACMANDVALKHLHAALEALQLRTEEREARGVEGTLER